MFRTSSNFDKLLDKATSHLLLEPDWPTTLQICDLIRQNDVQPKYVMAAIKKKLYAQNPHGAMFALQVLESIVKNCGSGIHDEVANKVTCEMFHDLVKTSTHENVRQKVLELIQAWAFAFRNQPKYRAVQDIVNIMKAEGFQFPVLKEADAMFSADSAPEWSDGAVCDRCRVAFGLVQRKHHCRACGKVFCGQCSQHTATIPKFGIEKEVRVCDACFEQLNRPATAVTTAPSTTTTTTTKSNDDLPPEYVNSSLAQQNQTPPRKTEEELREEEELQLALALSQSEAEAKEKEKKRMTSNVVSKISSNRIHSPPPPDRSPSPHEEVGPELARYLNRSYWEQRQTNDEGQATIDGRIASPSAPVQQVKSSAVMSPQKEQVEDPEMEDFVNALKSQVEIFVNRMKINSSRGRSIANDNGVQTLFMNITAMHSRLLRFIQHTDDERLRYEGLQDKLTQVKDARAALDALRDEHREKMRRVAEEAERQRQLQMAHKLEIMRKKKQEYLQYQRQLALQRIQEQEREMQMRQEQQKQQYLMGPQYPSMGPTYLGSPVHGANPAGVYPVSAAPPVQYQGYPQYTGGQMHMGPLSMIPPPPGAMMQGPPQQMQQVPPQAQSGMTLPNVNPQQQGPPGMPIAIMNMKPSQQMVPQGSTMQMGPQGPPQQLGPQGNPQQMGSQGPPQPMPPYPTQIGQQNSATGSRPPGMQQAGSMSQGIQQPGPSQQNSQKDVNQTSKTESETTAESPQNQTAELISFD